MPRYVIEKERIQNNIALLQKRTEDAVIWGVVKGDGYGLGVVPEARLLAAGGIDHFAVTDLREAKALREAGFREEPILMIRGTADPGEIDALLDLGVILSVGSYEDAVAANNVAAQRSTVAEIHLELDTGMGRYGFLPDEMEKVFSVYRCMQSLAVTGVYTHFRSADSKKITMAQYDLFQEMLGKIHEAGFETGMVHCCNSTAAWRYPGLRCDAVRVGSLLLGRVAFSGRNGLKPVGYAEAELEEIRDLPAGSTVGYGGAWKAKRPTTIAVVSLGWYHGYGVNRGYDVWRPRDCFRGMARELKALLRRKALYVQVNGTPCRVLGHVGMVNIVVDVTGLDCQLGDRVTAEINPLLQKGLEIVFR